MTVAGNGVATYSGDGKPATQASIFNPTGVAVDAEGNIFIADWKSHRIRKVLVNGTMTTVAGIGTACASSTQSCGDGGSALAASLNGPRAVFVDKVGNIYIADYDNHRVRKVLTNGTIVTVAGNGTAGFSDLVDATKAMLNSPRTVFVDPAGNIFIADLNNNRIRKVEVECTASVNSDRGCSCKSQCSTNYCVF
jgi:DNA-binding beta-propeller fold protein YncE